MSPPNLKNETKQKQNQLFLVLQMKALVLTTTLFFSFLKMASRGNFGIRIWALSPFFFLKIALPSSSGCFRKEEQKLVGGGGENHLGMKTYWTVSNYHSQRPLEAHFCTSPYICPNLLFLLLSFSFLLPFLLPSPPSFWIPWVIIALAAGAMGLSKINKVRDILLCCFWI